MPMRRLLSRLRGRHICPGDCWCGNTHKIVYGKAHLRMGVTPSGR
jgi:hypothetical protein